MSGRPPHTPAQRARRHADLAELAEWVATTREHLGLSLAGFARVAGCSKQLVSQWEHARRGMSDLCRANVHAALRKKE
jgi:DNA-binding transcriptional regulator YiaG